MKISRQLWLIVSVALLGMIAVWGTGLFQLRGELFADRGVKTRNIVEVAHTLVTHYYQLQQSGQMSEADAQKAALDALAGMRYDKTEYLWVNDMHPTMIMHPI